MLLALSMSCASALFYFRDIITTSMWCGSLLLASLAGSAALHLPFNVGAPTASLLRQPHPLLLYQRSPSQVSKQREDTKKRTVERRQADGQRRASTLAAAKKRAAAAAAKKRAAAAAAKKAAAAAAKRATPVKTKAVRPTTAQNDDLLRGRVPVAIPPSPPSPSLAPSSGAAGGIGEFAPLAVVSCASLLLFAKATAAPKPPPGVGLPVVLLAATFIAALVLPAEPTSIAPDDSSTAAAAAHDEAAVEEDRDPSEGASRARKNPLRRVLSRLRGRTPAEPAAPSA